jgi:chemotaxis signal transduction protein
MRVGDLPVRAEYLDDAAIARVLARRQGFFSLPHAQAGGEMRTLLLWSIGAEQYASPIEDVREVALLPRITPVPAAPAALIGVVSWRGLVHNLFDPAAALGAPGDAAGATRMIVLRHDHPRMALRVSSVSGIAQVPADRDEPGALARLLATAEGVRFALVSTPLLIERILVRRDTREG